MHFFSLLIFPNAQMSHPANNITKTNHQPVSSLFSACWQKPSCIKHDMLLNRQRITHLLLLRCFMSLWLRTPRGFLCSLNALNVTRAAEWFWVANFINWPGSNGVSLNRGSKALTSNHLGAIWCDRKFTLFINDILCRWTWMHLYVPVFTDTHTHICMCVLMDCVPDYVFKKI